MIKARCNCGTCHIRVEAEIVYDSRVKKNVYVYDGAEAGYNPRWNAPRCPKCDTPLYPFKVVWDMPDRYIDKNGELRVREYKDIE